MIWLTGWNYRKQIIISNTGSSLTDYQVLVTIDTASLVSSGKLLSNCNDIRFTSSDSATTLNYWIESDCNTPSTKIWVKIPYIASGSNAIYLYYGNPSATSSSNGTDTFVQYHGVATSQFFDPVVKNQPLIAEFRARVTSTSYDIRWGVTNNNLNSPRDSANVEVYSPTNSRYFIGYHDTTVIGGSGIYETPAFTVGQYYRIKIVLSPTELHGYIDGNEIGAGFVSNVLTANMGLFMLQTSGTSEQEWSFIRNYASPEPTLSIGSEQIPSLVAAEGGVVTTTATHRIHTFTSSGTFTVNKAMNVEYLVVAGGGGGGESTGGGGGAGGMLTGSNLPITPQAYPITVGTGGSGGPPSITSGSDSIFSTIAAIGGGNGEGSPSYNGGSGGGGRWGQTGGTGISGQGNRGGNGNNYRSGGGGGAGSAGGDASSTSGNGGSGLASSISGTSVIYAGGGGGGADSFRGQSPGTGTDGGGNGGYNARGTDATGIGCGGGGGSNNGTYYGGNGSAGIVIIRYLLSEDLTPANITATNVTITPSATPCIEGSCTMTIDVTWTNTGGESGTFTPSIKVDNVTVITDPPLSPVTIDPSLTASQSFIITDMTTGTHTICPDPN